MNSDTVHTPAQHSARHDAQVIGLVGFAHGTSHFFHLILAPLFPWLRQAFDLSYAELGLAVSVFFVVSGIGQAIAGFVVDRFGAWIVLMAGLCCLTLAASRCMAAWFWISMTTTKSSSPAPYY